jgi:2-amino-4-hydroxy-6-hydroxymethyldihydropteridine diphosphokinase
VAIAVGSNLGDRLAYIQAAVERLRPDLHEIVLSSVIETRAVGVPSPQPDYLNAAITGATDLSARVLLEHLLDVETSCGRKRPEPLAPRTLDLDLILYGDAVIQEEGLVVPHPRFRERRFVLAPLAEVVPAMKDPVTGKTVAELLAQLDNCS